MRFAHRIAPGLIIIPALASAQTIDPAAGGSTFTIMLQVLFGLALVLGAFALVAMLMRRFMPVQRGGAGVLRVAGAIMVGPRERVVLLEVGDTWLILGVANGQVRTLHSMPRGALTEPSTGAQPAFAEWLARTLRKSSGVGK
jgi:flagellar protein FliO/FliZ